MVKNLPANAGDTGSTPDLGRSHIKKKNFLLGGKSQKTRAGVHSRGSRVGKSNPQGQKSVTGPQEGAREWKEVLGTL